jgi:hypothetical protein
MPQSTYLTELQNSVAHIDRENAFLLYATFTGDLERTAHALNVRACDVLLMADEEKWNEKLKPILDLKKSTKPGDIERAINRALNFVQAHRMRMVIERVIKRLSGMNDAELEEYMFSEHALGKEGNRHMYKKLTTRALADLASAIEKCHAMSYAALNDSAPERGRRKDDSDPVAAGDMHVKIAEAMQKAAESKTVRAQLFDAQVAIGQQTTDTPIMPPSDHPNDNDDH